MKKLLLLVGALLAFGPAARAQTPAGPAVSPPPGASGAALAVPGAVSGQAVAASTLPPTPLRFGGVTFDFSIYDSSGTNAANYFNTLDFYFAPSWQVGRLFLSGTRFERLTLSGRFVLTQPLFGYDEAYYRAFSDIGYLTPCTSAVSSAASTDSTQVPRCPTSHDFRTDWGDIWLTLSVPRIYTLPVVDIHLSPAVRFDLPTSLQSQFATQYTSGIVSLGLSRTFWTDKITLGYTFGARKNFQRYTAPQFKSGAPLTGAIAPWYLINSDPAQVSAVSSNPDARTDPYFLAPIGGLNPNFGFSHIFSVNIAPTDKLAIGVLYILGQSFSYDIHCGTMQIQNVNYDPCQGNSEVQQYNGGNSTSSVQRVGQTFWLTVGYQIKDWVSVSAALITSTSQRAPDNSLRQPFFYTDYNGFTTISAGATFSIEKAAARLF